MAKTSNISYHRLTIDNRLDIQAAIHDGKSISQIAKMLKVSKSTISRELNRKMVKHYRCPLLKKLRLAMFVKRSTPVNPLSSITIINSRSEVKYSQEDFVK